MATPSYKGLNNMEQHIDELLKMPVTERSKLKWDDPRLDTVAERLEKKYELPFGAIRALKYAENRGSTLDSSAKSPRGAQGIMQFMPNTMNLQGGMFKHNVNDPVESMDAAGKLLQYTLKNQYKGNIVAAFADYNGGPEQAKYVLSNKPPKAIETQKYLQNIKEWYVTSKKKPAK